MNTVLRDLIKLFAPLAGLSPGYLAMRVDEVRRGSYPDLPLAKKAVKAAKQCIDPQVDDKVLQHVAKGLRLILNLQDDATLWARVTALLQVITIDQPVHPFPPHLVNQFQQDLCDLPHPKSLPPLLPFDLVSLRRVLIAAVRFRWWTEEDIKQLAQVPAAAAFALALGANDPTLWQAVCNNARAAAIALAEGLTDQRLIYAVAKDATAFVAAQLLVARPDILCNALITKAAERIDTAIQVLVDQPAIRDPRLITKAAQGAYPAAKVLVQCADLRNNPQLLTAICANQTVIRSVVDAIGPYPALWSKLSPTQQDQLARSN